MRRIANYFIIGIVICIMVMSVGCRGFQGKVYERKPDGTIGPTIPEVKITFVKEDGSVTRSVITDNTGSYRISLSRGRYWVTATHPDYEDHSTIPGFFVVRGTGYQTGNIFLRKPRVTTVLLARHADRANDSLSQAGRVRAEKLAHVARKAGVTAIYTTDFNRTKQTVQPLADFLKLEPTIYNDVTMLVNQILSEHKGDVVLVAGHSNTVPDIIEQLLGENLSTQYIQEFDNLFIITHRPGDMNGKVNVLNLQYGESSESSPPDSGEGFCQMTTVLLVRHAELDSNNTDPTVPYLSPAGQVRAEKLVHVARKAGVIAIYTTITHQRTIWPLANALNLGYSYYGDNSVELLVSQVLEDHAGEVVLIAGDNNKVSKIIKEFGGSPIPPIFGNEYDNLFVITVCEPGEAKVVSLQYGEPSP